MKSVLRWTVGIILFPFVLFVAASIFLADLGLSPGLVVELVTTGRPLWPPPIDPNEYRAGDLVQVGNREYKVVMASREPGIRGEVYIVGIRLTNKGGAFVVHPEDFALLAPGGKTYKLGYGVVENLDKGTSEELPAKVERGNTVALALVYPAPSEKAGLKLYMRQEGRVIRLD